MPDDAMTDLTIYDKMPNPLEAIKFLGMVIAKSRIFGCETPEQGMVLAWECLVRRVAPLSLKETYHLISTSTGVALTMRADAMLAGFLTRGGKMAEIQRDHEAAIIDLASADGHTTRYSCTIQDAIDAGYLEPSEKSKKAGKTEKDNWASRRQKMQMLWARAISDGVRAKDPRVCAGRYVPEDFGKSADVEIPEVPSQEDKAEDVSFTVEPAAGAPVTTGKAAKTAASETVTMPPTKVDTKAEATATSASDEPGTITAEQRKRIEELYEELKVSPEVRARALEKRKANSLRNLTTEQAGDILKTLEAKKRELLVQLETAALTGTSTMPTDATEAMLAGPCSSEQIRWAKRLIVELQQSLPNVNVSAIIKAKLQSAGMNALADLSMADMDRLVASLRAKMLEKWIESALAKPRQVEVAPAPAANGEPEGN